MSARNGDKARFNRLRKAKLRMRERSREVRKALQERTARANPEKKGTTTSARGLRSMQWALFWLAPMHIYE